MKTIHYGNSYMNIPGDEKYRDSKNTGILRGHVLVIPRANLILLRFWRAGGTFCVLCCGRILQASSRRYVLVFSLCACEFANKRLLTLLSTRRRVRLLLFITIVTLWPAESDYRKSTENEYVAFKKRKSRWFTTNFGVKSVNCTR